MLKFFTSVLHNSQSIIYGMWWTYLLVLHFLLIVYSPLVSSLLTFLPLHEHRLSDAMRKHLGLGTTDLQLEKWILLLLMHKLLMVMSCRFELSCFLSRITVIASTLILWYQSVTLVFPFRALRAPDLMTYSSFFVGSLCLSPLLHLHNRCFCIYLLPRPIY